MVSELKSADIIGCLFSYRNLNEVPSLRCYQYRATAAARVVVGLIKRAKDMCEANARLSETLRLAEAQGPQHLGTRRPDAGASSLSFACRIE